MSKEALAKVVQRAISDGAFRRQLSTDPATALRGFDLTADETAAIRSGDAGRLTAMGVELRMSKAFTLSTDQTPAFGGNSSLSNDQGATFSSAMSSGTNAATNSGVNSSLIVGDPGDNSAILTDGSAAGRDSAVIPGGPAHALGAVTGGDSAGATSVIDDNAEGFLTAVHTSGESATNAVIITTESPTTANAITAGEGATDSILVVDDDNLSGAASPGEATDGPVIQQ